MRRPLLAGNWKMNLTHREAIRLGEEIRLGLGSVPDRDVALFPTFITVAGLATALHESPIAVGGQNSAASEDGAFTGEVSASILRSSGAKMVLVGHSERRQLFGDTDAVVRKKLDLALNAGLEPIVCVGETLAERESSSTTAVVERQVRAAFAGLPQNHLPKTCVAYEPVWAIGTGKVATPEQAQEVHATIRRLLKELHGAAGVDRRILYGGSVKGSNIDGLMAMADIDGALVGGASLKADEFLRIIHYQRSSGAPRSHS